MIRLFAPGDLAALPTLPADKSFDVEHVLEQRLYFEVANVSQMVLEVQNEDGLVRAVVGQGQYACFTIGERTGKYILHPIASTTGFAVPMANQAVYAGVTRNAPPVSIDDIYRRTMDAAPQKVAAT